MMEQARIKRLLLGAIMVVYLLLQWPLWDYLTDDTWIHLVYARNLLLGEGWVFNPGEPSYGSTSPLWVLLLAPAAGSEALGLAAARLLAILAGLIAIPVFFRLSRFAIRSSALRLGATLLFATETWFLRWSGSGMESSLAVLALLLVFNALASSSLLPRHFFWTGLLSGLACLVRPEFYLLAALVLALALVSQRWRQRWGYLALGTALPTLPWLLFAKLQLGSLMPATAAAKSGLGQGMSHLAIQTWRLLKVPLSSQGLLLILALIWLWLFLRPSADDFRRNRRRFYAVVATAWVVLLPLVFLAKDVQIISRYLLPVTPLLPLAAFSGMEKVINRNRHLALLVPLVIVMTLGVNGWLYGSRVLPHARSMTANLEASLGRFAEYLSHQPLPDAAVACPDIGLIGYRSGCRVVDLGGLIHPEIAAHWHRSGYDEMMHGLDFLRFRKADYLIDRHREPRRLIGARGNGFILLPQLEPVRLENGLGIRKAGEITYQLYRIGEAAVRPGETR